GEFVPQTWHHGSGAPSPGAWGSRKRGPRGRSRERTNRPRTGLVNRRLPAAVALVAAAALAACTSHSSSGASTGTSSKTGGTAYLLTSKSIVYLDPQRVYGGRTIWLLGRLAVRTLVQYGSDTSKLYPDL